MIVNKIGAILHKSDQNNSGMSLGCPWTLQIAHEASLVAHSENRMKKNMVLRRLTLCDVTCTPTQGHWRPFFS